MPCFECHTKNDRLRRYRDNREAGRLFLFLERNEVYVLHNLEPLVWQLNGYRNEFYTYPIYIDYVVMVVPEALPYPEFATYLNAIASDIFFVYSSITILVVICLLTVSQYMKQKRFLFFQCTADVFNLLMNDNDAIKYRELSRAEVFIILPITFAGFVVVNGILSMLQSYLTRPIMQPQMNTAEDIHHNYRIGRFNI